MQHTALFFGSFNPIHVGHLIIANTMLQLPEVEEVWFVVSPQNPLKEKGALLEERQRLEMVRLAVADNDSLSACDVEMHLPTPSYTINTLAELSRLYPERQFGIVMGSDNLALLDRWRDYEQILAHYRLWVYPRPGSNRPKLAAHPNVRLVEVPMMELSSSYIRELIKAGKNVRYLVTQPVYDYIKANNLYV